MRGGGRRGPVRAALAGAGSARRSLAALLRDLSGRNDRALIDLIIAQLAATSAGAGLALAVATDEIRPDDARARMAEIEHQGDDARAALVGRLLRSLTSPIDREDLFRFSRAIDDVLDTLRDFVRETDLLAAPPHPAYEAPLRALAAGVDRLTEAVRLLPRHPREAAEAALRAKKPGVRASYQLAMADLLGPSDGPCANPAQAGIQATIKATLLLGRLDHAGAGLAAAVDALTDGVIKRFQ